jgi:hypothetical protein
MTTFEYTFVIIIYIKIVLAHSQVGRMSKNPLEYNSSQSVSRDGGKAGLAKIWALDHHVKMTADPYNICFSFVLKCIFNLRHIICPGLPSPFPPPKYRKYVICVMLHLFIPLFSPPPPLVLTFSVP